MRARIYSENKPVFDKIHGKIAFEENDKTCFNILWLVLKIIKDFFNES